MDDIEKQEEEDDSESKFKEAEEEVKKQKRKKVRIKTVSVAFIFYFLGVSWSDVRGCIDGDHMFHCSGDCGFEGINFMCKNDRCAFICIFIKHIYFDDYID